MRLAFVSAVLGVGLAAAPGCRDSLGPHGVLSGTWVAQGPVYTYAMHLTQTGDAVTGGGSLHTLLGPPDLTLTTEGSVRGSTATLTFHYSSGGTSQFTGRLVLPGFLAGRETGGWSDSLTFTRE